MLVPFRMPAMAITRSPEMPSRSTACIGIPPATLASIARLMFALIARSQISAPQSAMSSLFAVTIDFPLATAASMISLATVVPPISSATMSTFGLATTCRQSVVRVTPSNCAGSSLFATVRLQTAVTRRRKPSFSAIESAFAARMFSVPEPTFPSPITPTLTSFIGMFGMIPKWGTCYSIRVPAARSC